MGIYNGRVATTSEQQQGDGRGSDTTAIQPIKGSFDKM